MTLIQPSSNLPLLTSFPISEWNPMGVPITALMSVEEKTGGKPKVVDN